MPDDDESSTENNIEPAAALLEETFEIQLREVEEELAKEYRLLYTENLVQQAIHDVENAYKAHGSEGATVEVQRIHRAATTQHHPGPDFVPGGHWQAQNMQLGQPQYHPQPQHPAELQHAQHMNPPQLQPMVPYPPNDATSESEIARQRSLPPDMHHNGNGESRNQDWYRRS